ncbi:Por secretion system C-terminal sorting domain-containing protein [Lishizhenia tianjinensis]|uniref:Por secretion system C-terminal sorting domain-containing protein n=1 Tax=Lishizhenia tianjinensis TaxID=477690 RepID=A0A1I6ZXG6_9FLAO|nr:T9SS type A sorting domain-containing protein [Lishizhenia tianjinensis]SFT67327.1 Por secretion system C-terminal sorting domain-containing protein [Lishizhenia tianjinensis]
MKLILTTLLITLSFGIFSQHDYLDFWNTLTPYESNSTHPKLREFNNFHFVGCNNDGDQSPTKLQDSYGGYDAWIIKSNQIYNNITNITIGASEDEEFVDLIYSTNTNHVFVALNVKNTSIGGNLTSTRKGEWCGVLVKLDTNLNIIDQYVYGGSGVDKIHALKEFPNGDLLLVLISDSPANAQKSEDSEFSDIWALRVNYLGGIIWENTLKADQYESLAEAELVGESVYIISGTDSGVGFDKTEPSLGYRNAWVTKLDKDGNLLWDKNLGGSVLEDDFKILGFNNKIHVAMTTTSPSNALKSEDISGPNDMWYVQLDTNGNLLLENSIGSDGPDGLLNLEVIHNKVVLACHTNGPASGDRTIHTNYNNIWMAFLDTLGDLSYQSLCLINSVHSPPHLLVTGNNTYTYAYIVKNNPWYGYMRFNDYNNILSVQEQMSTSGIYIYPNPTENFVNISLENQEVIQDIQVMDIQGKEVLKTTQSTINMETLNQGIYLIKVSTKSGSTYTERIFKK